jgi:hypothetical protein
MRRHFRSDHRNHDWGHTPSPLRSTNLRAPVQPGVEQMAQYNITGLSFAEMIEVARRRLSTTWLRRSSIQVANLGSGFADIRPETDHPWGRFKSNARLDHRDIGVCRCKRSEKDRPLSSLRSEKRAGEGWRDPIRPDLPTASHAKTARDCLPFGARTRMENQSL